MSDEILFMDEEESSNSFSVDSAWNVLIVDDEAEIHTITSHVLKDFRFNGRGLNFLHAYSGEEAKEIFLENPDIALVFLDVVMETDDAGLQFARWLRSTYGNNFSRIVLRTGQPGIAPEKDIILNYDIDDYRAKTELTAVRLYTTTVSSIRTYSVMMELEENRLSLEGIIKTYWNLRPDLNKSQFLELITPQVRNFLDLGDNSFLADICRKSGELKLRLELGKGRFQGMEGDVSEILSDYEKDLIVKTANTGKHFYGDQIVVGHITHCNEECCKLLFIENHEKIKTMDLSVLKIFFSSLDSSFDNLSLTKKIEQEHLNQIDRQKKLLERLNNVISIRSRETGGHVRRVSETCELLATLNGCDSEYVELLKTASTMHDIGKIGIPDSILLKPGKLNTDERKIINTHTILGKEMFEGDSSPLIQMTRDVVTYHHEHWDGSGYPEGLKGESIPLSGRITAICDVFDALLSVRPYKEAIALESVIEILNEGRGTHFDPQLLDIFMDNIDSMISIFNKYVE